MLELTAGNVKAAMNEAGAKSSDLWMVPIANIRVIEGFNLRERNAGYEAHIVDIGESILANGYRKDKPLTGYVGKDEESNIIYVTDGHSRLEAVAYANAKGADIQVLPVVTTPPGTNVEDLTVGLFTANNGRPLTELEKAQGLKRLIGFGIEPAEAGRRTGITTSRVNDLLLLAGSSSKIRRMVTDNEVSATEAIKQIKTHGAKAAEHLGFALEKTKAKGGKKIKPASMKPAPRDLRAEGIAWIRGHAKDEADRIFAVGLLCHIAGCATEAVMYELATQELPLDDEQQEQQAGELVPA